MNKLLGCSVFLLWGNVLHAQYHSDSLLVESVKKNAIALYTQTIKGQTALYNGSQYKRLYGSDDEHPFYKSDDWLNGSVVYQKLSYENIPLLYDIVQDRVVVENFYNASETMMVWEKLDRFTIDGDSFVKINHSSLPKVAFYQLLYDGVSRVIVKRQKVFREEISSHTILTHFDQKDRYYIYKNGRYFQVKNKASALKLFEEQKKELKAFAKTSAQFQTDFGQALVLVAEEYDRLTKN